MVVISNRASGGALHILSYQDSCIHVYRYMSKTIHGQGAMYDVHASAHTKSNEPTIRYDHYQLHQNSR